MGQHQKKRKRAEDPDKTDGSESTKTQVVDGQDDLDGANGDQAIVKVVKTAATEDVGAARQKKSERKKRKDIEPKKNASEGQTSIVGGSTADGFMSGQDFINLADQAQSHSQQQSTTSTSSGRLKKAKRASPRSIRKQANASKIAAKLEEADAVEAKNGTSNDGTASTDTKTRDGKSRFIVFVGNLPRKAKVADIEAHFAKIKPTSVRLQTDRLTKRSKGFAFVEFANYDRMKTCLQLYHQSTFDLQNPGLHDSEDKSVASRGRIKKASRGRKINVELTAGGGGKSEERKKKIVQKNQKLGEERERVRVKQAEKKADIERKRILKAEKEARGGKRTGANAQALNGGRGGDGAGDAGDTNMGDIHPSRLARVPKG